MNTPNVTKPLIIRFLGILTIDSARAVDDALQVAVREGRNDITLALKSPGGDGIAGVWLEQRIRELPLAIATHGRQFVESAAVHPYLAGSRRTAEPGCTFLLHPARMEDGAKETLAAEGFSPECTINALLDCIHTAIVRSLVASTQLSQVEAQELCTRESNLTMDDALRYGIAHEVKLLSNQADTVDLFFRT